MLVEFINKMGSDLFVVNAARVCNLRCRKDTQKETGDVANQIDKIAEEHFPVSWKYLRSH